MSQHGVNSPGADSGKQAGAGQAGKIFQSLFACPARLGKNSDAEAARDQMPPEQGNAEGRVINIGVAAYQENVRLIPAKRRKLRSGHGQKSGL
jgi:hypothetical protein